MNSTPPNVIRDSHRKGYTTGERILPLFVEQLAHRYAQVHMTDHFSEKRGN